MWSGGSTGCPADQFLTLEAEVVNYNGPATITASVDGQNVGTGGGTTYNIGIPVFFVQWPALGNGPHNVTVRATAAGYANASLTRQVTYACPV